MAAAAAKELRTAGVHRASIVPAVPLGDVRTAGVPVHYAQRRFCRPKKKKRFHADRETIGFPTDIAFTVYAYVFYGYACCRPEFHKYRLIYSGRIELEICCGGGGVVS